MFIIDLIMGLFDLIEDFRFGKKYGWSGFLWELLGVVCLIVTVVFFRKDWMVPGVIGALCFVACVVCGIRRIARDVKKRKKQFEDRERKDESKIHTPM